MGIKGFILQSFWAFSLSLEGKLVLHVSIGESGPDLYFYFLKGIQRITRLTTDDSMYS